MAILGWYQKAKPVFQRVGGLQTYSPVPLVQVKSAVRNDTKSSFAKPVFSANIPSEPTDEPDFKAFMAYHNAQQANEAQLDSVRGYVNYGLTWLRVKWRNLKLQKRRAQLPRFDTLRLLDEIENRHPLSLAQSNKDKRAHYQATVEKWVTFERLPIADQHRYVKAYLAKETSKEEAKFSRIDTIKDTLNKLDRLKVHGKTQFQHREQLKRELELLEGQTRRMAAKRSIYQEELRDLGHLLLQPRALMTDRSGYFEDQRLAIFSMRHKRDRLRGYLDEMELLYKDSSMAWPRIDLEDSVQVEAARRVDTMSRQLNQRINESIVPVLQQAKPKDVIQLGTLEEHSIPLSLRWQSIGIRLVSKDDYWVFLKPQALKKALVHHQHVTPSMIRDEADRQSRRGAYDNGPEVFLRLPKSTKETAIGLVGLPAKPGSDIIFKDQSGLVIHLP